MQGSSGDRSPPPRRNNEPSNCQDTTGPAWNEPGGTYNDLSYRSDTFYSFYSVYSVYSIRSGLGLSLLLCYHLIEVVERDLLVVELHHWLHGSHELLVERTLGKLVG